MKNGLKLSLALLFSFIYAHVNHALAEDASQPSNTKGRKVFYASHSLMWYVPETLGDLAAANLIQGHELLGLQKIGASRTLQHWQVPDDANKAKEALTTGKVDTFVMSPIQFPDAGIEHFVKLGLKHNPNTRFLVQMSWGGGDIDNQKFPKGAWTTPDWNKTPEQLATMNVPNIKAGEAQIDALNETYGNGTQIVFSIPTAQAAVELRSRIYRQEIPGIADQGDLFVDPAHPSPPLEALNTYLHYVVVYRQSPVGLPMLALLKRDEHPEWDEKLNRTLQEIAWRVASGYSRSGIGAKDASENIGLFKTPASDEYPSLEFVYTAYVDIGKTMELGNASEGQRRVIPIVGGTFQGPRLQGEIIPGGANWTRSRHDGATVAEATYFLKTDDDVLIRITNAGVSARPNGLRFTTPRFEAPRDKYEWLNQSVFIANLDVDWNQEHPIRIHVLSLN
jgi:hypothetical protein